MFSKAGKRQRTLVLVLCGAAEARSEKSVLLVFFKQEGLSCLRSSGILT
jgi:hypothetical protein